jgi:hypothetical protein
VKNFTVEFTVKFRTVKFIGQLDWSGHQEFQYFCTNSGMIFFLVAVAGAGCLSKSWMSIG